MKHGWNFSISDLWRWWKMHSEWPCSISLHFQPSSIHSRKKFTPHVQKLWARIQPSSCSTFPAVPSYVNQSHSRKTSRNESSELNTIQSIFSILGTPQGFFPTSHYQCNYQIKVHQSPHTRDLASHVFSHTPDITFHKHETLFSDADGGSSSVCPDGGYEVIQIKTTINKKPYSSAHR